MKRAGSLWAPNLWQIYGPDRSNTHSSMIDPRRINPWGNRPVGWLVNTSRAYPQNCATSSRFLLDTLSLSSPMTRTSRQWYLFGTVISLGQERYQVVDCSQNREVVYWMRCSTGCVFPKERIVQTPKTIRERRFELADVDLWWLEWLVG